MQTSAPVDAWLGFYTNTNHGRIRERALHRASALGFAFATGEALKGHGFSRAASRAKRARALAPGGCSLIAFRMFFSIFRNMFSPVSTNTLSSGTERSAVAVKDPQLFSNAGERHPTVRRRLGHQPRCGQVLVFTQASGRRSRSTGRPASRCSRTISSASSGLTPPYQTASG